MTEQKPGIHIHTTVLLYWVVGPRWEKNSIAKSTAIDSSICKKKRVILIECIIAKCSSSCFCRHQSTGWTWVPYFKNMFTSTISDGVFCSYYWTLFICSHDEKWVHAVLFSIRPPHIERTRDILNSIWPRPINNYILHTRIRIHTQADTRTNTEQTERPNFFFLNIK